MRRSVHACVRVCVYAKLRRSEKVEYVLIETVTIIIPVLGVIVGTRKRSNLSYVINFYDFLFFIRFLFIHSLNLFR